MSDQSDDDDDYARNARSRISNNRLHQGGSGKENRVNQRNHIIEKWRSGQGYASSQYGGDRTPPQGFSRYSLHQDKEVEFGKMSCDEDPEKMVINVIKSKDEISLILNDESIDDDHVKNIINIFYMICQASNSENKNIAIKLLKGSTFLNTTLGKKILEWGSYSTLEDEKFQQLVDKISTIFVTFQQLFPSRYIELPLDIFNSFLASSGVDYDESKIEMLLEIRKRFIERTFNWNDHSLNHSPEYFRELSIIPNRNDILENKPFLRAIKSKGAYENGDDYLDIHFRLLREDFIRPLRTGVLEIMNGIPKDQREIKTEIYCNIRLMYAECTKNGIIHKISFQTERTREILWKHSRKLLFGNLLCLSKDKFDSFIFATVANCETEELENGILSIRLNNINDVRYLDNTNKLFMIESASYFEAYKYVLDSLKELNGDEVPLQRYIVDSVAKVNPASYLTKDSQYNLKKSLGISDENSSIVTILDNSSWPHCENTDLNRSQLEAFKHAVTKEFVLIQGPPGTGKTHVGLRIVNALLQNKKDNKPLLMVCYTNHALDQFVSGLSRFGHENLIRVGGGCAEELQKYNLKNNYMRLKGENIWLARKEKIEQFQEIQRIRDQKRTPWRERQSLMEELSDKIEKRKKFENSLKKGYFLPFSKLKYVMTKPQHDHLKKYISVCNRFGLSVFDLFLKVINIEPNTLFEIKIAEEDNINNNADSNIDTSIEVEGEGDRLVNLYVKKEDKENETRNQGKKFKKLIDKNGFEYKMPSMNTRLKFFRQKYEKSEAMLEKEAEKVVNPWKLDEMSRWRLFKYWTNLYKNEDTDDKDEQYEAFEDACLQVKAFEEMEDAIMLKNADAIAMTTTGAAKYRNLLSQIEPSIVVVEEAAEVLEAHVISALNKNVKHLILIGDHQQLQPNPSVYELSKRYGLNISLFQRMINNKLECHTLNIQHRMRPEVSLFMKHIYSGLANHPSVKTYPDIMGVEKNVFFLNLESKEHEIKGMKSKMNIEEAMFIRCLCLYLIRNGYKTTDITIITGYAGQVIQFKKIMEKELFEGVRVTSVDNYQGEENKIILLSLVRSEKIGFWKQDTRTCVALSRAKEGLYVVGNLDLFARNSPLWKAVLNDADQLGFCGKEMVLVCQNHPNKRTIVSKSLDFENAPEGGCSKACKYRLNCGHVCEKKCHPLDCSHEEYICKKRCPKTVCELKHPCTKRCHYGESCGECFVPVLKKIPKCGHVENVACNTNVEEHVCQVKCIKILPCSHQCQQKCGDECNSKLCKIEVNKLLPCGHEQLVPCHMAVEDFPCKSPCEVFLKCKHKCSGNCFSCKEGRLHKNCRESCERKLQCSHICKERCGNICLPCTMKCENRCGHRKCKQACGKECTPCKENCLRKCKHEVCTKLCHEECDRGPCNKPCLKVKKCGHRCIGFCGEPCPSLCRVCNKNEVEELFFGTENDPNSRFIQLEDCKHIFESRGLDHWMSEDKFSKVMLKQCPKCKRSIRKSLRYGNIIKAIKNNIQKINKLVLYDETLIVMQQKAYDTCRKLRYDTCQKGDTNKILNLIRHKNVTTFLNSKPKLSGNDPIPYILASRLLNCNIVETVRIINQANFFVSIKESLISKLNDRVSRAFRLSRLSNVLKDRTGKDVEDDTKRGIILKEIQDLQTYVLSPCINGEQFENAILEFKRINLHINFYLVNKSLNYTTLWINSDEKKIVESCLLKLGSCQFLNDAWIEENESFIETVKKKFGCNDIPKKELNFVIKPMGVSTGQWFKCANGHFYCIEESEDTIDTVACPECKIERRRILATKDCPTDEVDSQVSENSGDALSDDTTFSKFRCD